MSKAYTATRLAAGLLLGSRVAAAAYTRRHENMVRRHCEPIACDVTTKAALYDLDAALLKLHSMRRVA